MTSRTSTLRETEPPRLASLTHAVGGAVFGLALARCLFEGSPARLTFLGDWPGALGLTLVAALLALGLAHVGRTPASPGLAWAPLALLLPLLHILPADVNLLRGVTLLAGSATLYVLLRFRVESLSLYLFLFLFLLYLTGLAPSVGEADTFEFQVGIARLGIAHGSGYPLLMLVGKIFSLLPIGGTLAWRANLTSAFFAALAAVGVERLARRLGAVPLAAALAALAFGVSPTLWSRAVEVEAYALNAALVASLLLVGLSLLRDPDARFAVRVSRFSLNVSCLPLLAFLMGLSLTNHLTAVLLAPALLLAIAPSLWRAYLGRGFFPTLQLLALRLVLPFLIGLSVYLYVPLRWPAVNNGEWMNLAQFANILGGNEARGALMWDLPWRDAGRWAIALDKVAGEYGPLPLALAGVGLVGLVLSSFSSPIPRPNPSVERVGPRMLVWSGIELRIGLFFVLAYLPYLYFALAFNVPDPDFSAFFIPLHLLAATLMAGGLQFVMVSAARVAKHRPGVAHALARAMLITFAVLPLQSLWTTLPRVDQSDDWERQQLGEYILGQPLAEGAAILADSQKIAPLYYLQVAEGTRPDLDIIVLPDEAAYRAALDERIAAGQVVYLARYIPGLGMGYSLRSVGPLAEVSPQPFQGPSGGVVTPTSQPAATGLRLLGFAGPGPLSFEGGPLDLTLVWQAVETAEANLLTSLRLVDGGGNVAWRNVASVPVGGLYPTNAWRRGEVVTDYHRLSIPAHVPPGIYRLEVGLFAPFAPAETGWGIIGDVLVPVRPVSPPARLLRARLGNQWLLGYDLPETAAHGAPVPVSLYWRRGSSESVSVLGEARSLSPWPDGAVAPMRYMLTAPATGAALPIRLSTSQTARCGWLAPPTPDCTLPAVALVGEAAAPGAVNFGSLLLLRSAALHTARAAPGGAVSIDLEWQALQTIADDFTVFVHLLGPDGLVHGQVDAWPVSGTRATTTWRPGEVIGDPYTVSLSADAPPGEYLVEIGLYLLATGERLPVLNAEGAPVDDRLLLAGLTVAP